MTTTTPECLRSSIPTDHAWAVLCTGSDETTYEIYLVAQCIDCGAIGHVQEPTQAEWDRTTGIEPYGWEDGWRVAIQMFEAKTRFVTRTEEGEDGA